MLQRITGYRDGEAWPAVGEEIDLPDWEAENLVVSGLAKHVEIDGTSGGDAVVVGESVSVSAAADSPTPPADDVEAPPARRRRKAEG